MADRTTGGDLYTMANRMLGASRRTRSALSTDTALLGFAAHLALAQPNSTVGPFAATVGLLLMSYLGIAISLWPYAVPRRYTL